MKYLFIELKIQDGERTHTHRVQHTTNAKNINFVAERYAATYWDSNAYHEKDYWWHFNEITIKVEKVMEMTKEEHEIMNKFFI